VSHPIRNGKILTRVLEFSAAYHCNLNCADCSHLSPYTPRGLSSCDSLTADLEHLAPALHADEFRLLGGEPLLNPELPKLAQTVRASGIADRLAIITNGLLLHRMDDSLWEQLDRLDVTIYPGAQPTEETLARVRARAQETGTKLDLTDRPRFRAMALTEPQPNDWIARLIFKACQSAHVCHYHIVSEGWLYRCPMPLGMPHFLNKLGHQGYEPLRDGLELHAEGDLLSRLDEFLNSDTPSECCRYCLGDAGIDVPHRRLTKAELEDPALYPSTRGTHFSPPRLVRGLVVRWWRDVRGAFSREGL
jgi:GTP 3',8-cyclase